MKKQGGSKPHTSKFFGVYLKGETEPRSLFMNKDNAILYDYVRFGDYGLAEIRVVDLPSRETYYSLPFMEGLAFIRVMKMRSERHNRFECHGV